MAAKQDSVARKEKKMGTLIQDVRPPANRKLSEAQKQIDANYLLHVETEAMVTELYMRGVSIQQVFGQYYALEEMGNAHSDQIFGNDEEGQHGRLTLTVEDALLAAPPKTPLGQAPF